MKTIYNNLECEGFCSEECLDIEPGDLIIVDGIEKEVDSVGVCSDNINPQITFTDGSYANFVYENQADDSVYGKWITRA
jgi:hypothetical protein